MAYDDENYFDRAWKDLSADDGWWKAIFAFGIINCVPIVGQIIMVGYLLDWAKEAAWGMKTSLTRQMGDFGRRAKYGLIAWAVLAIWVLPVLVVAWLLLLVPVVGGPLCFLVELLAVAVFAIAAAGALRAVIYEHVMPGIQVGTVLKMARRNPGGLAQCFCILLLLIPLAAAALFIMLLPSIPFINVVATTTLSLALGADLALLIILGMLTLVVSLVVWVAGAVVSALICALYIRALGYWMEGFRPAEWKSPKSPLPFETDEP